MSLSTKYLSLGFSTMTDRLSASNVLSCGTAGDAFLLTVINNGSEPPTLTSVGLAQQVPAQVRLYTGSLIPMRHG